MKTFNSTVGAIGTGATVSSFNLSKNIDKQAETLLMVSDKKDLIKRMKKTLVPFTGRTIKSNKL